MTKPQKWFVGIATVVTITLIYALSPILTPFLIAAFLAYIGNPLVRRLIKFKIPRTIGVLIVFFVIFTAITSLLLLLVPLLERQILYLANRLPDILAWFQNVALPWFSAKTGITDVMNVAQFQAVIRGHWQQAGNIVGSVIKTVTYSGFTIFVFLLNLILIPIVTFYLLRDWDDVVSGIHKLLPRQVEPLIVKLVTECNDVLGAFFRGQLLVMFCLGIYYSIALSLVGIQLALTIGIIVGIVSIVPYLGFMVGILISIIATVVQFHDWMHLGYVAIVFAIGNVLENYVLSPWLVGDRIGLHPVAVIFAVLAGGELFGFVGVLLALPIAAVIMVLIRHITAHYLQSSLYKKTKSSKS